MLVKIDDTYWRSNDNACHISVAAEYVDELGGDEYVVYADYGTDSTQIKAFLDKNKASAFAAKLAKVINEE